jgi:hypothetical protein
MQYNINNIHPVRRLAQHQSSAAAMCESGANVPGIVAVSSVMTQ